MDRESIETRRRYCPPLHHHAAFAGIERIGRDGGSELTVSDELAICSLGLPFHTRLSDADVDTIVDALSRCL